MNINNVDINNLKYIPKHLGKDWQKSDIWKTMFLMQEYLRKKYKVPIANLDTRKGQGVVRELGHWTIEEICEMLNTLKNHSWTEDEKIHDFQHYLEELGDVLHFFLEFMIVSGITSEMAFEAYVKKYECNLFRIKSGY